MVLKLFFLGLFLSLVVPSGSLLFSVSCLSDSVSCFRVWFLTVVSVSNTQGKTPPVPGSMINSASSEDEDGDGRPESCITSSLTEADVRSRFKEVRSYLYANGKEGEYRETLYLLSRSVHSFTHETRAKRKAREGGETQATLRDLWRSS